MNRINDLHEYSMTIEQIDDALANARYERSLVFRNLINRTWQKVSTIGAARQTQPNKRTNRGSIGLTSMSQQKNLEFGQAMGRWMNVVAPYLPTSASANRQA